MAASHSPRAPLGMRRNQACAVGVRHVALQQRRGMPGLSRLRQAAPSRRQLPHRVVFAAASGVDGDDDYYRVLQVDWLADDDEIKEKYRRLQKIYHPDVWRGEDDAPSSKMSTRLNRAYDVLSDRKRRDAYDKRLGAPTRSARAGAIRDVEGVVGPVTEEITVLKDVLPFGGPRTFGEDEEDADGCIGDDECVFVDFDFDAYVEAVDYVREWAKTLAFAAENPLPMSLQVDDIENGARIAFVGVDNGAVRSIGELLLVVAPDAEADGAGGVTVEILRRNAHKLLDGREIPGEARIVKAFRAAIRRRKGEKRVGGLSLSGPLAAIASGFIGGLPWAEGGDYDTDAYHLRRDHKKEPGNPLMGGDF